MTWGGPREAGAGGQTFTVEGEGVVSRSWKREAGFKESLQAVFNTNNMYITERQREERRNEMRQKKTDKEISPSSCGC